MVGALDAQNQGLTIFGRRLLGCLRLRKIDLKLRLILLERRGDDEEDQEDREDIDQGHNNDRWSPPLAGVKRHEIVSITGVAPGG